MARAALAATGAYALLAIVLTWPLAGGLTRDVPGDLIDPLLNIWILSWSAGAMRAILGGDLARVSGFFDANIFHPAPLTLAYSEHLAAQAAQALPVFAVHGNPILAYNLLFLSTFVLSGLGAFLLVRELTGSAGAAFVAGLLFAFAPYRWSQVSHLQVLSAQWMPLAIYGLRRYFVTGRRRALAGGAAALTLQNLSCGYFLLYFTPLAGVYVLWELTARGRWRHRRTLTDVVVAGLAVVALTVPFLIPYQQVRAGAALSRDRAEVVRYSADVYSYFTAFEGTWPWGRLLRAHPKPEGDLFPGAVPLLLAGLAIWWWLRTSAAPVARPRRPPAVRWALRLTALIGGVYASLTIAAIFLRRLDLEAGLLAIRATDVTRLAIVAAACGAILLWQSPPARAKAAALAARPEAVFVALLVLAWWMSLGPFPRTVGRPLDLWSPYRFFYDYLPGFDGLRAPARFAMIAAFALSVLAGMAAARIRHGRSGTLVLTGLAAAFLLESQALPMPLNAVAAPRDLAAPEARVHPPDGAPAIYGALARLPDAAVVIELPFGDPVYDVRAVYYSIAHGRKLANGYSGYFPPHYSRAMALLATAARGDDLARQGLRELAITHVVLHEGAYLDDAGIRIGAWLRGTGAVEVLRNGSDVLYELRDAKSQIPNPNREPSAQNPEPISEVGEEENRRPRDDGDGEVEAGEQRHDAVDFAEVEADAEQGGHALGRRQGRAVAEGGHQRRDDRVGFDVNPEGQHSDVGEDAVEALREQEQHQRHVAERGPTDGLAPHLWHPSADYRCRATTNRAHHRPRARGGQRTYQTHFPLQDF